MMTKHDVITFHMDHVYGQHIHPHLTIRIKFAISHHYLLCCNPLQSAQWQHNNFLKNYLRNIYSGSSSSILDGVKSCHMGQ